MDDHQTLDKPRNFYSDAQAVELTRQLPEGTEITLLQGGDDRGGWVKARTAEGEEGYLFADEEQARRPAAVAQSGGCLLLLVCPLLIPGAVLLQKLRGPRR